MTKFKIISLVSIVVLLNFTVNIGIAQDVSQTKVYHEAGKNSVHLKDCSRLVSTSGKTVMTLAEVHVPWGPLPLCSAQLCVEGRLNLITAGEPVIFLTI